MSTATKKKPRKRKEARPVRSAPPPSYSLKAGITLMGYWVGFVPGVVMNFVFLSEAKKARKETGQKPAGYTWLQVMIWLFVWLPLLAFLLVTGVIVYTVSRDSGALTRFILLG